MANVALIETKPSRNHYKFDFEFDHYHLCSDSRVKKVLKADCDIQIDLDSYEWVILVGSEPLKYFTKINSITTYTGKRVEEKFLPIINPAMIAFKPEARSVWEKSVESLTSYVTGEAIEYDFREKVRGLTDKDEIIQYINEAIAYKGLDVVAVDSETSSLYPRDGYVLGISLSYREHEGVYISADSIDDEVEDRLKLLFTKKRPIFHNAKFDVGFLEYHFNFGFDVVDDTMLLHYLINENEFHGLKDLTMRFTPYGDYEKELEDFKEGYCKSHGIKKADFTYDLIPFEVMWPYAGCDAMVTLLLYQKFKKILENKKLAAAYNQILIPGSRFLTDVQDNGVPFDIDRLKETQQYAQKVIDKDVAQLYTHPEIIKFEEENDGHFNPNSVVQLRKLLFDYCKLKPTGKLTAKGAHSTDAEVLKELSEYSEIPKLILSIRQKSKIKNTYLDKIIPQLNSDGRLRTNFNMHITTSGRLSSSGKLNMQQLPRDDPSVKGCIKARPGYKIVSMDLTTAEVYVAAVLSGDQALMDVFRSGGDFHGTIAHKVFRLPCEIHEVRDLYPLQRQAAKAVSFGIMYGAGAAKISEEITKESGKYFSRQQAQEVIDQYFGEFKVLKRWLEQQENFIKVNKYIYSCFGRKRRLLNVDSEDKGTAASSIRSGLNFLVQSPASDINLLAGIDMNDYIKEAKMSARIFALVHDSILAEVPENEVDQYCNKLRYFTQMDRGVSIPDCPIGCDFEVGDDYSFGKYEKKFGNGNNL